jgi:hypothetical protein
MKRKLFMIVLAALIVTVTAQEKENDKKAGEIIAG